MNATQYPAEVEVRFGESVVPSRVEVAKRYAALTLPGVDARFYSRPQFVERSQEINEENL